MTSRKMDESDYFLLAVDDNINKKWEGRRVA